MGKSVSTDQSHAIMAALATNVDWTQLDGGLLQEQVVRNPTEAGKHLTSFLKNGARLTVIVQAIPFDPATFLGKGWTIEEQDKRSLALAEVDLSKVHFETCLKDGETSITGEEKLKRLKQAGHIRLDARFFLTLWKNQKLIPEAWKEKTNGNTTYIYFDGTVLRPPHGRRFVLCLCWRDGQWFYDWNWLDVDWDTDEPSAVLASA